MHIGVTNMMTGAYSYPGPLRDLTVMAEDLGYESIWGGEHIVLPTPQIPPSPWDPLMRLIDPLIDFAYLAAVTTRIKFGTGIIILPQRQPTVLAKQLASLDVMSEGRAIFGVGIGHMKPEFAALEIPWEHRGTRTDEYIDAIRSLWNDEAPAFEGRFVRFSGVDAHPRPVQPGGVPIVIGGLGTLQYRRSIARGNGWYGILNLEDTAAAISEIHEIEATMQRPSELGELEITITPTEEVDEALVAALDALGVDRIVLLPRDGSSLEEITRFIEEHAPSKLIR
jgi:probable F420-dependent oxidoreductase